MVGWYTRVSRVYFIIQCLCVYMYVWPAAWPVTTAHPGPLKGVYYIPVLSSLVTRLYPCPNTQTKLHE